MKERQFGPIRFIPGENKGKYPYCHSLFIEGAGILIDPSSDREKLKRLKQESDVNAIWLSHWHEDHFMHLDLFDDLPLWISRPDAPQLSDVELFLDGYGIENGDYRRKWRELVKEMFHYRPRKPAGYLEADQIIKLDSLTVEVLHTPGHTPGHLCFLFREPAVLFLGDYDLTPFGPWYGDRDSSIQQTIASVERLKNIPAGIWLTSHETGVFEEAPADLWDEYLAVIHQREAKLLAHLEKPRTMQEIVEAWIVYRRAREPAEFYEFAERAIMQKHLEILMANSTVAIKDDRYCRDFNSDKTDYVSVDDRK
jgi:glyoxylase-like metal-dependent hydrolase (beta-lactamase superfamily II)